ncbi:MAG: pyrrolo-quinoline quinone [Proteobacteria bacterium]|nr:MAG: pyrrolo-quinoline quinone [Pseudomonadota bacterium]
MNRTNKFRCSVYTVYLFGIAALWSIATVTQAVDDAQLRAAADNDANWITYGHGFANQRYSALAQINKRNVRRLVPKWIYQTGILGTFPTSPLIDAGVMYLTTPRNHVIALDAATGKERWRYTHVMAADELCCGTHNRGLAMAYGALYMITADARLVALEIEGGTVRWDIPMVDPATGNAADLDALKRLDPANPDEFRQYTRFAGNMAPVVYDGKVFVGVSGAGYTAILDDAENDTASLLGRPGTRRGLRAFFSAYDAATGRLLWRWYSTSDNGWEGDFSPQTSFGDDLHRDIAAEKSNAHKYRDAWQTGGGSIYASPSIDPELGLIYFGTGNASPGYAEHKRPGDNLYTSSVIALDINNGKLRWHHQITPHDIWGYDVASPPVLIDITERGKTSRLLTEATKSGWLYVFDRVTGEPLRRSEAFVPHNALMFHRPTKEGIITAPGAVGGANWPPTSYSPETGWLYVTASHYPSRYHLETDPDSEPLIVLSLLDDVERWGTITAIDPRNGKIQWQEKSDLPLLSGVLATAGGLVFYGESNGNFIARDASSGAKLWGFATGAGVNAPPVTYSVDGEQFVAVAAGGHRLFKFPLGDAIIAFGLPDER